MADQKNFPGERELENSLLFEGVKLESIRGVLEDCRVQELKAGEVLIHKGQVNDSLYLLLSGRLRVHLKLKLDPITVLKPGEIVGELSLIDRQPTTAYVVADEECRLLVIDEKSTFSLLEASPVIARNLLAVLARRLRHGDSFISTSEELHREYERHVIIDALTGVYTRRWLDNVLTREMERCKRDGTDLCLLLFDIDLFERYDDTHGRAAADRALYTVARTLREGMRPGEIIVRYGEDKFIALLPEIDPSTGQRVGERVRQKVSEAKVYGSDWNPLPSVTISVAVAQMKANDTPKTFIASAEAAIDRAKKRGQPGDET